MLCKDCFMRVADCNACAEPKITIPENATNGDMIIKVFPKLRYTIQNGRIVTTIGLASSFDKDWWNSPYKADMEGE